MASSRSTWWVWIITAVFAIVGTGLLVRYLYMQSDPCLTESREYLIEHYPDLKILDDAQQEEMSLLLAEHRKQDIKMNLQMSSANISPEQALQLSIIQINQIAELRKRHNDEFSKLCHQSVEK